MKEKKISLVTYVLSLIIMALVVAIIMIAIFNKKDNKENNVGVVSNSSAPATVLENNAVEKNVVNQENMTTVANTVGQEEISNAKSSEANSGTKLKQFDTSFYTLTEVSKEYRECDKITNYKDFNYDLDGDRVVDKITIKNTGLNENKEIGYQIQLNGKTFLDNSAGIELRLGEIYIVDLDENDKTTEVVIYDNGHSDDPSYTIFSKNGKEMKKLKTIYGIDFKLDKNGKVVVNNELLRLITPEVYDKYYEYSNKQVKEKDADVKKIKDIKFEAKNVLFTSDMKNLEKYFEAEQDDKLNLDERLKKAGISSGNMKFNIINFTEKGEIYVKLDNGKKGYVFPFNGFLAG